MHDQHRLATEQVVHDAYLSKGLKGKRLARPLDVKAEDHCFRLQTIIVIRDIVRRRALS